MSIIPVSRTSRSYASAMFSLKCPHCRQGNMFVHPTLSPKFIEMHENCRLCGFHFEIETGFYWGAMYFSYGITVLIALLSVILTNRFGHDPEVWVYLSVMIPILLICSPYVFRISRAMMLYMFGSVSFDSARYGK